MAHTEKFLLHARNAETAAVIKRKWVYDQYTAECFAADWHMKYRQANIYVDETLYYGYESEAFKLNAKMLQENEFAAAATAV